MAKPPAAIRVEGLAELVAQLKLIDKRLPREVSKANKEVVQTALVPKIRRKADAFARSGKLKRSVRGLAAQRRAVVAVGSPSKVPYAGPINFGWPARGIAAQEIIYSTISEESESIREVYIEMVDSLSRRAFPQGSL